VRKTDDALRAPISLFSDETTVTHRLNSWWEKRTIPGARPGLSTALAALNVSTPLELLEKNRGLSLSDQYWIKCCELLGVTDASERLEKMLALDYLLANHDRHLRNFGLIRDVDTLAWRVAPLFDNGSSLWCDKVPLRADDLEYVSQPFVYNPNLQLSLVKDFSWFAPEKLYGFVDFVITTLQNGPLSTYALRLNIIEDALYERLDHLIDYCANSKLP
jgi:hypothetical protein